MKTRKLLVMCSAILLALATSPSTKASGADTSTSDAYWWWFEHVGIAKIVRRDNGISGNIRLNVSDWVTDPAGLTITLWIVIFNNPAACATPYACGDPDFGNPDVKADVVYGGGTTAGVLGRAMIEFHYRAGSNIGSIANIFFLPTDENGEGFGLIYPRTAEVHYVARFHGPRNRATMPDQINSYEGGCVFNAPYGWPFPEFPGDLYLGPGDCQDVIFAIHSPPIM